MSKLIADMESKPLMLPGCRETKFLQCVINSCVYAGAPKWEADTEDGIKHTPCVFQGMCQLTPKPGLNWAKIDVKISEF